MFINNPDPVIMKECKRQGNSLAKARILGCSRAEHLQLFFCTDDTDYINQAISSNSPDTCRTLLTNLERKGNPQTDPSLLTKLIDCYTRVFSSMPLGKYSQVESYAKMLVRFAELKA